MLAGGPHLVSGVGQELSGAAINQTEMHYVTAYVAAELQTFH